MFKYAPVFISLLAAGTVSANNTNTGSVEFIGAVTDTTCVISPQVGGAAKSSIDLGSISVANDDGKEVSFKLSPDSQGCLEKTSASISWNGPGFNPAGVSNMGGTASGVAIQLTAVNSNPPNQAVTSARQTVDFGDSSTAIGDFQFKAKMVHTGETVTPGTVVSSASYAVAYK